MKVKEAGAMEAERRVCTNCKRDVAAANFSLHEAHCVRFLAVCAQCQERVALKDMTEHLAKSHEQVRCKRCHQRMQQFLLERHEAEECKERPAECPFCELELPYCKLQPHLEACGSRTTLCWDCSKYVMYKALEQHKRTCPARGKLESTGPKGNQCQQCSCWFPDEQYLQHLNECSPLPQLLGALTTQSSTTPGSPPAPSPTASRSANTDVRPKKDKELSLGRPSLKPPKSKKSAAGGRPAFTITQPSAVAQALDDSGYDQLVTCSLCNILLPIPTLQKHEKKCRRAASLQTPRRSPRFVGKGEESL